MALQLVKQLPDGPNFIREAKLDGYRALILKDGAKVEIRSRNDRDLTGSYPEIAESGSKLLASKAIVDGEIVALDPQGRPSFQALQHRGRIPGHHVVFYAFDLLHLNGHDLIEEPIEIRRAKLGQIVNGSGLLLSHDLPGQLDDIIRTARRLGLEGVVAKRRQSIYEPGERSGAWQKLKLEQQQEYVVGGYRPGFNAVDALLVGYYEGRQLHFAGKVKAGFVAHVRRSLLRKLKPIHQDTCPFIDLPNSKSDRWGGGVTAEEMHEMQWVKPQMVVQIRFVEWTAEQRLRHAVFIGERTDKSAKDVRREVPSR